MTTDQRRNTARDEALTIGEIAQLAGLATSTLRYYESIGLIPPPRRVSGQRRYSVTILPVLVVIQIAKEAHFTLPEIQTLVHSNGSAPSERWKQLAQQKIHEIDALVNHLQDMRALLEEGLTCESLQFELDSAIRLAHGD
jgi:MerR family redox-sensitive transcriptional activator SoxR